MWMWMWDRRLIGGKGRGYWGGGEKWWAEMERWRGREKRGSEEGGEKRGEGVRWTREESRKSEARASYCAHVQ